MTIIAARSGILQLSPRKKVALRRFAFFAVLAATVFTGVSIALQIAILAKYPGTDGDPIMRVLAYLVMFSVLGTILKAMMLHLVGPRIERRLGTTRQIKLRCVFNRQIWRPALLGGMLNCVYGMLFVFLVPFLAPTALAASRACIVLALVPVDWLGKVFDEHIKQHGKRRLAASVVVTLVGAAIVIFAHGTQLFKGQAWWLWLVFIGLLGPGNLLLAFAELNEQRGVEKDQTAPAVYTLARFITYTLTCTIAAVAWGLINHHFGVFVGVFHMMVHRWYFWVPISLFWALTDMVRICVKTVVPATFMYVVMSLAVSIDALTQTVAKHIAPGLYSSIPPGWAFPAICFFGGLVVAGGSLLWPHQKDDGLVAKTTALVE